MPDSPDLALPVPSHAVVRHPDMNRIFPYHKFKHILKFVFRKLPSGM